MTRPPITRVSKAELREAFNRLYLADVLAGRLSETIEDEGPPNRRVKEPPGTLSQTVRYWDADGHSVAVIHRYLRPDGTLGASGMPDPKAVVENGVLHAAPPALRPPNAPKKRKRSRRKRR